MPGPDTSPPKHTDLEILEPIYRQVHSKYVAVSDGQEDYMLAHLEPVASKLGMDRRLLYGRLVYDLGQRYRHVPKNQRVGIRLFSPASGAVKVNVPFLASVVADLTEKQEKHNRSVRISVASALIAFLSLGDSLAALLSSGGAATP